MISAAPTPIEAKNAHSCVTPRNRGRVRCGSTPRAYAGPTPTATAATVVPGGLCRPKCNTDCVAARSKQRNLGRLSEIAQVAVRHGFGYAFEGRRGGSSEDGVGTARGRHLREMLDELGPTFVKFGQLLSTRPDVVPPDIIAELRGLQDDVRPFPFADVERMI